VAQATQRRYDVDWLRIFAMLAIFSFHCAMYFNSYFDWHVKNHEPSLGLTIYGGILIQWMMPLFFVLSAMSIYYSLRIRKKIEFLKERFLRLIVPLIFGIFVVIVPVQVWIERKSHGQFSGSFIDFYKTEYFKGLYGINGNFAWTGLHLWYLEFLFVFTLILLPIFLFLNTNGGKRFLSKLASFSKKPYVILLFALPVVIIELLVNLQPQGIGIRVFGGWSLATYLIIFLMGYIIASNSGFQESLEKSKTVALVLAVIGMVAVLTMFKLQPTSTSLYVLKFGVRGLDGWFWVAAILEFGYKYLRFNNKFVQYATRAVLPFYILHQTVIVVIGYYWLDWNIIPIVKYFALAIASFIIVTAIYDLIIKRVRFIGFLFGLKLEK